MPLLSIPFVPGYGLGSIIPKQIISSLGQQARLQAPVEFYNVFIKIYTMSQHFVIRSFHTSVIVRGKDNNKSNPPTTQTNKSNHATTQINNSNHTTTHTNSSNQHSTQPLPHITNINNSNQHSTQSLPHIVNINKSNQPTTQTNNQLQMDKIVNLTLNNDYVDFHKHLSCKYAPVKVTSTNLDALQNSTNRIIENRKRILEIGTPHFSSSKKFQRKGQNNPIIVLSAMNPKTTGVIIKNMQMDYLAWSPKHAGGQPIHIFVHSKEYKDYIQEIGTPSHENLIVTGWDLGSKAVGFGATRYAAILFAKTYFDNPNYDTNKCIIYDQDVLWTPETDPIYNAQSHVPSGHINHIQGMGSGIPIRTLQVSQVHNRALAGIIPNIGWDGKSPVQQALEFDRDAIMKANINYPIFMVTGGEDMFLTRSNTDVGVRNGKIEKMDLKTLTAVIEHRDNPLAEDLSTLKSELFKIEKDYRVNYNGNSCTVENVVDNIKSLLDKQKLVVDKPTISSNIIERIILKSL